MLRDLSELLTDRREMLADSRRTVGVLMETGWSRSALSVGLVGAALTLELHAEKARASLRRDDPRPLFHRRVVPNVARVAALEVGHPVAFVVLMEADDAAFGPACRHGCEWRVMRSGS